MPQPAEPCDRYFAGKHVLVTGGSEGLGLALAARAVRGGAAAVTLIARTKSKLERAAEELRKEDGATSTTPTPTLIQTFSADVTDSQALDRAVREAEKAAEGGGVDVLIAAAGAAECGYFHEAASSGAFARQMQLNYLGVVHAVQAVYGGMVERAGRRGRWMAQERQQRGRRRGAGDDDNPSSPPKQQHILIVASAMSLLNFVGYAAYSPSKWALRGLAEGLRNELQGSGIGGGDGNDANDANGSSSTNNNKTLRSSSSCDVRVTIAFPPDVDTPGYARESLEKPPECAKISEGSPLYSADAVARCVVKGMAQGCFVAPNPSPVLALLQALCRGVVPPSAGPEFSFFFLSSARLRGWLALPLEMLLGFFGPLIASVAGIEHDGVARAMAPKRFAGLWRGGGGEVAAPS
jgi:NAD(P)-dependent dehydrogenase (short-subunit alcohol dehydrogenase family)